MENPLALQPFRLSPEALNEPLPFDLYSGGGTLLSKQGTRLNGNAGALLAQSLFRARLGSECDEGNALQRLASIFKRYGQLTERWSCHAQDVQQLKALAVELADLCNAHSDLCVCMAAYLPAESHATRHCFATAVVAVLLGNALGWDVRHQYTLARAALTMNLSLLSHHDDWARTRGALSSTHRMNVQRHPCLSADLLSQSPGADMRWITAVDQHHENLDGSGYPLGLAADEIAPDARALRVADTWCALALRPWARGGKTPRDALRELHDAARARLDRHMVLTLKKLMGAYPPGTFVRLANRETALVVRWDRHEALPRFALSIMSAGGRMMQEFQTRDVTRFGMGIRDYTHLDIAEMARLPWPRIWTAH